MPSRYSPLGLVAIAKALPAPIVIPQRQMRNMPRVPVMRATMVTSPVAPVRRLGGGLPGGAGLQSVEPGPLARSGAFQNSPLQTIRRSTAGSGDAVRRPVISKPGISMVGVPAPMYPGLQPNFVGLQVNVPDHGSLTVSPDMTSPDVMTADLVSTEQPVMKAGKIPWMWIGVGVAAYLLLRRR